ncbi:hypothetical protein A0J57_03920 [Sphingobium sp. 22B]|uniref:zinc-dependent alcohol dehydrogenase n=1 Tax=unclassified Sphingobium TaxID=2611147 RepID=UPI0007831438|nr:MULTISPECIES: alcohol dehydrogenase catalytic domain-containing protein [unclassified Sphingobium]KXU33796.1 hypothetical protein AXW74_00470 [Sphingobium sp. AM]KYC33741.1 hypothetical protein A0J57_03920 [Sphingobium sp. 22B]OAP33480.1 hypothetical protein A8O16_03140 [Sphingobium sp. 20006FA]
MKAAIFKGAGQPLAIEEVPEPVPGPHEAVVRVSRCGICGTDVSMTSGVGWNYPLGSALGHEFCGEVVSLGPDVERLRIGDRLAVMPQAGCGACRPCIAGRPLDCERGFRMMMGGLGEFTLADERWSVKLPSTLSETDGALIEPMASALRGVRMGGVDATSRIAVIGVGAMGAGAIYWSRRQGASRVAALARSARRRDLASTMGATSLVPMPSEPGAVAEALQGAPDIVFECTGAPEMVSAAIDLVRPGGTIVFIGICGGSASFVPAAATMKEAVIRFTSAYSLEEFQATADAFDAGGVEPRSLVDRRVGLDEVPAVLEAMRSGSSQALKTHVHLHRP